MTTTADIIEAIDAEGGTSWAIADAVAGLDEVDDDTGKPLTLKQVAERIWNERGVEWSPKVLGTYRQTALAFPRESRDSLPTPVFGVAKELRAHPDKLRGWAPKKEGDVLTVERARALRGGGTPAKPKPDAWKAKVDRALGVIVEVGEVDPAAVIEMLLLAVATLERRYAKFDREGQARWPASCVYARLIGPTSCTGGTVRAVLIATGATPIGARPRTPCIACAAT